MKNEEYIKQILHRLEHPGGQLPPGLSENEIVSMEERLKVKLPQEVYELLLFTNAPFIGGQALLGISKQNNAYSIEELYKLYPQWQNQGWLPVGDDGCGNYYITTIEKKLSNDHPVFFVEATFDPDKIAYVVASSISHFVEFLIERELKLNRWPFDQNYVLLKDPDILKFKAYGLPWKLS